MSRAERLAAALAALVQERRTEIDAIRDLHGIEVRVTFDAAGIPEYEAVRYETKRHRRRPMVRKSA